MVYSPWVVFFTGYNIFQCGLWVIVLFGQIWVKYGVKYFKRPSLAQGATNYF